jgi:hypothetical protein
MKRSRLVIVVVLSVVALLAFWPGAEPSYRGKPLRFWLQGFESNVPSDYLSSTEAVRAIGTNAIPFLLASLAKSMKPKSSLRDKLDTFLWQRSITRGRSSAESQRYQSLAALDALAPDSAEAIPLLKKYWQAAPEKNDILVVLGRTGQKAVPHLERFLTHTNQTIASSARVCLNLMHSKSFVVAPADPEDFNLSKRIYVMNAKVMMEKVQPYLFLHPPPLINTPKNVPRPYSVPSHP